MVRLISRKTSDIDCLVNELRQSIAEMRESAEIQRETADIQRRTRCFNMSFGLADNTV